MSGVPKAKRHLGLVQNYKPGKPLEELEREYGVRNAAKLASNENALGPSPKALAAMRRALEGVHRYPDGNCFELRRKLSKKLSMPPDRFIFGNGSDELLIFAVRAFVGKGDEVVTADPTFLIYAIAVQAENGKTVKVPLKNFRYDLDGMLDKIGARTKVIFIASPDNPVGTYISESRLKTFLKKVPRRVLVVLDEAYYEFARSMPDYPDSPELLRRYPNLLVTRTFSKAYGLAGLRIGYGMARPEVIDALNKVREPFNVNRLAQEAAVAALDDRTFLAASLRTVARGRAYLSRELSQMGFKVIDTATNFILFDCGFDVAEIYERLLRQGVIVRPMAAWGLDTMIRVTIGKPAENRRFVKALNHLLKK